MSSASIFNEKTAVVAVDQTDPEGTAARHKALQRICHIGMDKVVAASTEKIVWVAAMGDPPELTGIGWMQYDLLMNAIGPVPERMPTTAQRAAMANQFLGGNDAMEAACYVESNTMQTYAERLREAYLDYHLQMLGGGGAAEEGERAPKRQRPSPAYEQVGRAGKGGSHNVIKVRNGNAGKIVVLRVPTITGISGAHISRENTVRTLWETWGGVGPKSEALRAILPPYFEPYMEVKVDEHPEINFAMPVALGTDSIETWKSLGQAKRWASARALGDSLVAAFEAGYVLTDAKPRNFVWYAELGEGSYRVCDIDALSSCDAIWKGAFELAANGKGYTDSGPSVTGTYIASVGAGTTQGQWEFWPALLKSCASDHRAAATGFLRVVQYDALWASGMTVLMLAADTEAHQQRIKEQVSQATLWSHKFPAKFEGCGGRLQLLSALSAEAYYGANADLPVWFENTFIARLHTILNKVPKEIKRTNTFASFA